MKAVQEVEFSRYLVADTPRDTLRVKKSAHFNTRVKSPVTGRVVSVCQTTEVVMQGDVNIETVGDTESAVSTESFVCDKKGPYSLAVWNMSSSCFARAFFLSSSVLVGGNVKRPFSLTLRRTSAT